MSSPPSHFDPSSDLSQTATRIISAAANCLSSVSNANIPACMNAACETALTAVSWFEPRFAGVPDVKWCGPDGERAPQLSFTRDFVDRRSTVAWALYRLTVTTPVDEPIFSAQARVTMHGDRAATFSNFNKPAAKMISSINDSSDLNEVNLPEAIGRELESAAAPLVYVVLAQMAGFDDVILYTSLFNFSAAFAAFQTGPWRSLKQALAESQANFQERAFSVAERRAIERAALTAVDQTWEASWRQPVESIRPMMNSLLSLVASQLKP